MDPSDVYLKRKEGQARGNATKQEKRNQKSAQLEIARARRVNSSTTATSNLSETNDSQTDVNIHNEERGERKRKRDSTLGCATSSTSVTEHCDSSRISAETEHSEMMMEELERVIRSVCESNDSDTDEGSKRSKLDSSVIPPVSSTSEAELNTRVNRLHDVLNHALSEISLLREQRRKQPRQTVSRKRFSELSPAGQKNVVSRVKDVLGEKFPNYEEADYEELFQRICPKLKLIPQLSEGQTMRVMELTNSTFNAMDKWRSIFDILEIKLFASKAAVNNFRKLLQIEVNHAKVYDGEAVVDNAYIADIREALCRRIEEQIKSGKFKGKDFALCMAIDKGGDTNKLGFMLSADEARNGPSALLLAAVYRGAESRALMAQAFEPIFKVLESMKEITVLGETIKLTYFVTADLKCLKSVFGIRASTCKKPCVFCTEDCDLTFSSLPLEPTKGNPRNFMEVDRSLCQDELPLLPFIDKWHIFIPLLHIFMGAASRVITFLVTALYRAEFGETNNLDLSDTVLELFDKISQAEEKSIEAANVVQSWVAIEKALQDIIDSGGEIDETASVHDDDGETDEREYYCDAPRCVNRLTGLPMEDRHQDKGAVDTWIFCKDTSRWYHTVCVGINSQKKTKKQGQINASPSLDTVLQCVKSEKEHSLKDVESAMKAWNAAQTKVAKQKAELDRSQYVQALFKLFEKFGADRRSWYQTYTGAHIRRILVNASKITTDLKVDDLVLSSVSQHVKDGIQALVLLGQVQSYTQARMLTAAEVEALAVKVQCLREHMILSTINYLRVGHKWHVLFCHVVPFARHWSTLNYFSEQAIESTHAKVNQKLARIKTRDREKQYRMLLQWWFENNIIRERFGSLQKATKLARTAPEREVEGGEGEHPSFLALAERHLENLQIE